MTNEVEPDAATETTCDRCKSEKQQRPYVRRDLPSVTSVLDERWVVAKPLAKWSPS